MNDPKNKQNDVDPTRLIIKCEKDGLGVDFDHTPFCGYRGGGLRHNTPYFHHLINAKDHMFRILSGQFFKF